MPISTPNREADPVSLEAYEAPCILRQEGGLFMTFYNNGATSYIAGEPVVMNGWVGIVQRTTLPGETGTIICNFIVDAILDTAHSGDIDQGVLIYWDTDLNVVLPQDSKNGTSAVSGIGAASTSVPTNGFILGRAIPIPENGSNVVGRTGSKRVRVVSLPDTPTEYP